MDKKEYNKKYREKHKEELKEYDKKYREQHKNLIKERKKKYYKTNKKNLNEISKIYVGKHKEKLKEKHKEYYLNNKDYITKRNNLYYKEYYNQNKKKINERVDKYQEVNKEQRKKYLKEYDKVNKHKQTVKKSFRRLVTNWNGSRKESESLLGYTFESLKIHLSKFGDRKDPNIHIDHILPIAFLKKYIKDEKLLLKIAHDLRNLMLLPKCDNLKKGAKLTIEYIPDFHMYDFFEYICELIEYKQTLENKI